MKLSAAFGIVEQIREALKIGVPPVLRAIYASPSLIFNLTAMSRISMANVWILFGQGGDEHSKGDKTNLITPHATGIVLDVGAGHGYTANYLDRSKVTKYIAVEPNVYMHGHLRAKAEAAGFSETDGSFVVLSCGAEDTATILSCALAKVDTIVSVQTLCTVPSPQNTLRSLVEDVLAPGGELLFYEHVLNPREDVAWWQKFWTPIWRHVFDGCCLDRPTDLWVKEMVDDNGQSLWSEGSIWKASDSVDEENLFWRLLGRFVKK
ncbi:S-adenosyl-L-methionine-dependent methyltransferase [Mycena galericulata]|nr:S-adenosyl-L-methionine-dependent methyltransferase [Mycena galericulata]